MTPKFFGAPKSGLTALFLISLLIGIDASYPGFACEDTNDCATSVDNYLECDLSTRMCQCTDPIISQFDYFEGKCYRKIAADCPPPPAPPPVPPPPPCTPNSVVPCGASGVCECDAQFTSTVYQKCVKPMGTDCTNGNECDQYGFQTCRDLPGPPGTTQCGCQGTYVEDAVFDQSIQKCVLKVGTDCTEQPAFVGGPVQPCEIGSECNLDKCRCRWPMSQNDENHCRMPFNATCDDHIYTCDELKFMTCGRSSGRCECDETTHKTFYDIDRNACLILASQDCNEIISTGQECVENSACRNMSSGPGAGNWYCMCEPGFQETLVSHQCYLPHGQTCVNTPPAGDKCNFEAFQECGPYGVCDCANLTNVWYDAYTTTCFLLEGASCTPNGDYVQACAPNSHCAQSNFGGICRCDSGLKPNEDRKCRLEVNDLCAPSNDLCDDKKFLQCNPETRKCDCAHPADTIMDENQVCRLKAGSPCSQLPAATAQQCVQFADCLPFGANEEKCFCKDDLHANNLGQCVRSFGAPCGDDLNGGCDPESFLSCQVTDGEEEPKNYCQCLDPVSMDYDEESKKCFLKLSAPCSSSASLNGSIECQKNTVCDPISCQCVCDSNLGWTYDDGATCVRKYGSFCDPQDGVGGGCHWMDFLDCIDNTCQCLPNYSPLTMDYDDVTTRCVGNFGANCTQNEDCNAVTASLGCRARQCACFIESEQTYDLIDEKCYSQFGGTCNVSILPQGSVPLICNSPYICAEEVDSPVTQMGRCGCPKIEIPGRPSLNDDGYDEKLGEKCTGGAARSVFKFWWGTHLTSFLFTVMWFKVSR